MHETVEYPHELRCAKSADHSPSLSERICAESELLGEMPKRIGAGFSNRVKCAASNLPETAAETACFAVAGCAVGLIVRNPIILGESCAPLIALASRWAPPIFAGVMGADLAGKTAGPMVRAWNKPGNLPSIKIEMGDKLGAAAFDYSLSGVAGIAGGAFAAPTDRFLTTVERLTEIGQPKLKLVSLGSYEIHAPQNSPPNETEFVAFSKPWERGSAPQRIAISSRIFLSKDLSSDPYLNGDVWMGIVKTKIGEGLRFVFQIYSEADRDWKNADFWNPAINQLYHGINEFHMALKKEAMQKLLRSHTGRVMSWEDNFKDEHRSGYKLSHVEASQKFARFQSPELLLVSGPIYRGAEAPLASAKSIPKPGTVWLKYVFDPKNGIKYSGNIVGRIFDGEQWQPLHLEQTFGPNRLKFDSVKQANVIATGLEVDLRNRTLAAAVRDGKWQGYILR